MLCISVEGHRRFARMYCLCLRVEDKQATIKKGYILACEISLFCSVTTLRNIDTQYVRPFLQPVSVHLAGTC